MHPSVPRHTDGADHQDQTHPDADHHIGRINDGTTPRGRHPERRSTVEERVLVSADTDFGTLLARSGADKPSVVLIRRAIGRRAAQQARLLIDNLPEVQDDLEIGAVVVFGETTIRIRRLPI